MGASTISIVSLGIVETYLILYLCNFSGRKQTNRLPQGQLINKNSTLIKSLSLDYTLAPNLEVKVYSSYFYCVIGYCRNLFDIILVPFFRKEGDE